MNCSSSHIFRYSLAVSIIAALPSGCANDQALQSKVQLSRQIWLDITVDESVTGENQVAVATAPAAATPLSYQEFAQQTGATDRNAVETNFTTLDRYRRIGFYAGTAGAIYSLIANNRGDVLGRTLGNGLWGIG